MNWLNLTPLQAAIFFSGAAALATWFYYRERRQTRLRVSTLQFWSQSQVSLRPIRRLRDRKAWIAQLLFLLLLVLAIADIRRQSASAVRSVAVVLDTSIWSQVRGEDGRPYIELEREEANRILNSLGENDRVLLLRAEAAPSPLIPFTTGKAALRRALAQVQPSSTVADLPRAFSLARSALAGSPGGLLLYVGPGMIASQQLRELEQVRSDLQAAGEPQLSVRLVKSDAGIENCGITSVALQRDPEKPNTWHMLTKVTNYGQVQKKLDLEILLNGSSLGRQQVPVGSARTASLEHEILTTNGGLLELQIRGAEDALEADDHAVLSLPETRTIRVAIVTADSSFAQVMRNVLATNHDVVTEVVSPQKRPTVPPDMAIYSEKPSGPDVSNSIVFVRQPVRNVSPLRIEEWNGHHPVTQWIRTHDVIVRRVAAMTPSAGEVVLARGADRSPLVTAREQEGRKTVVVGFDPRNSNILRQDAFPLLMAGAVEWMTGAAPDTVDFRSAGTLTISGEVKGVTGPSNTRQVFSRNQNSALLLAEQIGVYRIQKPEGEVLVGVNAPPLPSQQWQPLAGELAPLATSSGQATSTAFWTWLILPGMVALWVEWWLFYSNAGKHQVRANSREGAISDAEAELKIS